MNDPSADTAATWPADTTVAEVARWASEQMPPMLICFVAASRRKSGPEMATHIKAMRHVITRMDQFRRMKEKQWAAEQSANSNEGATRT